MYLSKNKDDLKNEYYSWLRKNQEHKIPVISSSIDSLYNVSKGTFEDSDIQNLRRGLELNHTISWALAEHVSKLAEKEEIFANLLKELSMHPSAEVRFNIVTNCIYNRPQYLIDDLLSSAIHDRSMKVRLKAANVILRLNKVSLAEKILERIEVEKEKAVQKILIWVYDLLSKNWAYDEEWKSVSVRLKDGGICSFSLEPGKSINDVDWIRKKVTDIRDSHH